MGGPYFETMDRCSLLDMIPVEALVFLPQGGALIEKSKTQDGIADRSVPSFTIKANLKSPEQGGID
jgi:hypothetical protein